MNYWNTLINQVLPGLWRRKWIGLGSAWLVCLVGWAFVGHIPTTYESQAVVYISPDIIGPLAPGGGPDPVRYLDFLQRTLLSRRNIEQLAKLAKLDIGVKPEDREALYEGLAGQISLKPQTQDFLRIAYRNADPAIAHDVMQAFITIYGENTAGATAKRALDNQIEEYSARLRDAEKKRSEFLQTHSDILSLGSGDSPRVQNLRTEMSRTKSDLAAMQATSDSLQRELNGAAPNPGGIAGKLLLPPPLFSNLNEARNYLAALRARFPETHPYVAMLERQITEMESKVKARLAETQNGRNSLLARLAYLEREADKLEALSQAAPALEGQAQELDRNYASIKKNYNDLVQRRDSAELGYPSIQFRVVQPPDLPSAPSAPNRFKLLSEVLLGGLAAGLGLPFFLLRLDRSIGSEMQLLELGFPVLGSVSKICNRFAKWVQAGEFAAWCSSALMLLVIYAALLRSGAVIGGGL